MKCDVCENEATVFLTQIINGQMTTVNLCEACSKAKGVTEETGFGLAEAFLSPSQRVEDPMEAVCSACGFTASQFKKISTDGLSRVLSELPRGTRRSLTEHAQRHAPCRQASASHRAGRPQLLPRRLATAVSKEEEPAPLPVPAPAPPVIDVVKLRAALDLAVKEERYEDAAKLKAEIEQLQPKSPQK
ncbi:MAG: UvrB/UvrC motif-containing protein [Prosthecobacter sp.]